MSDAIYYGSGAVGRSTEPEPLRVGPLIDVLERMAPGALVKVMTDGGIYKVTDVTVSYAQGHVLLVGERGQ